MEYLCENWKDADKLQIEHNRKVFDFKNEIIIKQNHKKFLEREDKNPENEIKIEDTNPDLFEELIEKSSEKLDWSKAVKLPRYTEKATSNKKKNQNK